MNKLKQLLRNLQSSLWLLRLLAQRAIYRHYRVLRAALSGFLWWSVLTTPAMAQGDPVGPQNLTTPQTQELSLAPTKVAVQPIAQDEEIRKRLLSVMEATGWFVTPQVEVENGVVFLNGRADTDETKIWAGELARNTQDVVAVANRIEISQPSVWDFREAWGGLSGLSSDIIRSLPFFAVALLILALSAGTGWLTVRNAQKFLVGRVRAKLLRGVLAGVLGVMVFLVGTYIVLRVSGLTQLALTVVGGTGLIGLAARRT